MSGIDLLKIIRKSDFQTKVLMITSNSSFDLLVEISELRISKYLIKPITRSELQESIKFVIKELKEFKILNISEIKLAKNLLWNNDKASLYSNGEVIELTNQEIKIINLFANNIGRKLSYDDIIIEIWGYSYDDKVNSLKTSIKKLRKKVNNVLIDNIYSYGYILKDFKS